MGQYWAESANVTRRFMWNGKVRDKREKGGKGVNGRARREGRARKRKREGGSRGCSGGSW